MTALPFPKKPRHWPAVTAHLPREPSSPGLLLLPRSPHRSESARLSDRDSNRVPITGVAPHPSPGRTDSSASPHHSSPPRATLPRRPWIPFPALTCPRRSRDQRLRGRRAAPGRSAAPGTAESKQPQPRDQPAPGTAGRGEPRHHPAAGGLRLPPARSPPRLGSAPLGGDARVVGVPRDAP